MPFDEGGHPSVPARRPKDPSLGARGFAYIHRPVSSRKEMCPGPVKRTPVGGWKCLTCVARSKKGLVVEPPEQHRKRVRSPYWAVTYYANGEHHTVSTRSTEHAHAVALKKKLLAEVWGGKLPWLAEDEPTLSDLLNLVRAHYELQENSSVKALETRCKNLVSYPDALEGNVRSGRMDESYWQKYCAWRKKAKMSNGTVNRELAVAKQAFKIGTKRRRADGRPLIDRAPHFEMLREAEPRQRFAEEYEVAALIPRLRLNGHDDVADLVECYSLTGRRNAELRVLKWEHVNWFTKVLVIERTKNRKPQEIPFGEMPELEELLKRRKKLTEKYEAEEKERCEWVFHRNGKPIKRFERAWRAACEDVGIPVKGFRKLTPHDFRRRQARDVMEATGDPMLAADLVGWQSLAMLKRYRILTTQDRSAALSKLRTLRQEKRRKQEEALAGKVETG